MSDILLVNNEKSTISILTNLFKTEGFGVMSADNEEDVVKHLESSQVSLMITSASADFDPEISYFKLAGEKCPDLPVIIITDGNDNEISTKAYQLNPFATASKPLKIDQLLINVQKAISLNDEAQVKTISLNLQLETTSQFENIVAESLAMKSVCNMVSRIASTDVSVLLTSEPGCGKDDMASEIHNLSMRKKKKYLALDCKSSDLEHKLLGDNADPSVKIKNIEGTIYLKDVDAMPLDIQSKLSAVLKQGQADEIKLPRIIASTSESIEELMNKGNFNNELHKTLKAIVVKIPPLRERQQDILATAIHYLREELGDEAVLPAVEMQVVRILEEYSWPGNNAEVAKVIRHIANNISGRIITKEILLSGIS